VRIQRVLPHIAICVRVLRCLNFEQSVFALLLLAFLNAFTATDDLLERVNEESGDFRVLAFAEVGRLGGLVLRLLRRLLHGRDVFVEHVGGAGELAFDARHKIFVQQVPQLLLGGVG